MVSSFQLSVREGQIVLNMLAELTRTEAQDRLAPPDPWREVSEESAHPWLPDENPPFTCPLLRTWDIKSGSQPDSSGRMFARAISQQLLTRKARQEFLEIHINHRIWEDTPFISFTTSADTLQWLAEDRYNVRKRGPQHIVAINANVRIRKGLPILSVQEEMKHYGIPNPYKSGNYAKNHYICLWEVNRDEIAGQWDWNELKSNPTWYQDVVMPAYQEHETKASAIATKTQDSKSAFDLSDLFQALSDGPGGSSPVHAKQGTPHVN